METTTRATETEVICGRRLTEGSCEVCGCHLKIWLPEGGRLICSDCRANEDRARRGWHPENSRD